MDAGNQDAGRFWSEFGRDPREADNQGLRAGDRDRDIIRDAISEAYADGRLTREELDTRLTQVQDAKLLGDLLPVVADLIPSRDSAPKQGLAHAGPGEIDRLALDGYNERRRRALAGMFWPTVICLTIWVWSMIGMGGMVFPWPLLLMIVFGRYLARLIIGRESAIEEEREKLRKKQAQLLTIEQGGSRPDGAETIGWSDEPRPNRDHWR